MRTLSPKLVRCLTAAFDNRGDSDLLNGFLTYRTEADFAELVRRYGPMVWGACSRTLPDYADAEDAFQTVFLVLVQRGNRLVDYPSIGPWLHRVALWTARNIRRRNARRLARRATLPEHIAATSTDVNLSLDLDAALLSLPEKFRSPILLCHVLGLSRAEAASQLGCAERTLSLWLARGLAKLRHRLRGLDPTKALGIAAIAVPVGLSESVVRAAASLQTAAIAASVLSPTVSQLVEGVIRMFWVKKATAASVALFAMFAFGVGVGVTTHQLTPAVGGDEKIVVPQPGNAVEAEADIDARIAELKKKIAEAEREYERKAAMAHSQLREVESVSANPEMLEKFRKPILMELEAFATRVEELKIDLNKLLELKASKTLARVQSLTPAQKEILVKLEKQEVEFDGKINEMTLSEVLRQLTKKYGVTFVIMEEAFKNRIRGYGRPTTVNISQEKPALDDPAKLKGVKLGAFLDLVLNSMDATYVVRPDYIEITTVAMRLQEKVTRVFPNDGVLPNDDDKTLHDLQRQLNRAMSQLEAARVAADRARMLSLSSDQELKALQAETETLREHIQELTAKAKERTLKDRTISKPAGPFLQLTLGGKDAAWPYQVKEFSADGKPIGTVAFENADVLGRYLARTVKDSSGPRELRIVSRADSPAHLLLSALEACKSAGLKDIVFAKGGIDDNAWNDLAALRRAELLRMEDIKRQQDARVIEQQKKLLEESLRLDPTRQHLENQLKLKDEEIRKLKEAYQKKKAGEGSDPPKP